MGVPSCVMIPYVPSSEVSVSDEIHTLPEEMIVTMGPPGLIDKLSNTIANTDGRIRIYDSAKLRDEIFPDGDTRVSRLISDGSSKRFTKRLQANYLVLVGATKKSDTDSAGEIYPLVGYMTYAGFWGAAYNKEEVRLSAIIIDLQSEQPMYEVSSSAEGTASGIGLFYLVAIFPLTESSTIKGLGRKIAEEITQNLSSDVVDIAVMAIEPLKFTYSLDRQRHIQIRLKTLLDKASQGNPDAQYNVFLIMKDEYTEPAVAWGWLCKAADQGYKKAQEEVGYWHNKTNWERARPLFERLWLRKAGIQADNRVAYMWYNIAANGDPDRLRTISDLFSGKLSEEEIAEADDMIRNWKPGQCPTPYQ